MECVSNPSDATYVSACAHRQPSHEIPVQVLLVNSSEDMARRWSQELLLGKGIQVRCAAQSRREGKWLIDQNDFDVMLIDPLLKDGNGFDLIAYAKKNKPMCEVVVAGHDEGEDAIRAFALGAMGYVSYTGVDGRYAEAVQQVACGGAYMTPSMSRAVLRQLESQLVKIDQRLEMERLTPREVQILRMVAEGHTSLPLGKKLGISRETVNAHVKNILRKLNVRTRAQAIFKAYEQGLL
jgi:DNA-binding NarL/FixJ family response regulator